MVEKLIDDSWWGGVVVGKELFIKIYEEETELSERLNPRIQRNFSNGLSIIQTDYWTGTELNFVERD